MAGIGLLSRRRAIQSSLAQEDMGDIGAYVQDSMLMWLDGLEKGAAPAETWQDLIEADNNYTNYGAWVVGDGYNCGDNGYLKNTISSWLLKDSRTMEILLTFDSAPTDISVPFIQRDQCFSLGIAPSQGYVVVIANGGNSPEATSYVNAFTAAGTYAVALRAGDMYVNGTLVNKYSKGSILTKGADSSFIGRRGDGSSRFYGVIHSIRIHDRALTVDELNYNLSIDRMRFSNREF